MNALATLLFYLLLALGAAKAQAPVKEYDVPPGESIFETVSGVWGWQTQELGCATNPETIRFTDDHSQMLLGHIRPDSNGIQHVTRYDVLGVTASRVRVRIVGETRTMEGGTPVVWELVLTSRDSYRWHRVDMPSRVMTKDIERCLDANETSAAVDRAARYTIPPRDR